MTNEKVKNELIEAINKLMPANKVAAEIAARSGYARQYVYQWINTDLIHAEIQKRAMELLTDLRAEASAQLETIKNP
jgi:hypothetical protein